MSGTKVTGLLSHLVEEGGESGGIPTSRAPALIPVRVAAEKSEKEMMLEAKRWLLKLGSVSALDAPQDVQDSLSDPRRNGVLLCEVVFGVDKQARQSANYSKTPKTLGAARQNIESALQVLRRKKQIPTDLLWQTEEILKGNMRVLWTLMWYIMQSYPEPKPSLGGPTCNDPRCTYSGEQFRRLEVATLLWMSSLGLFHRLNKEVTTLDDCIDDLSNGTVLCDLVSVTCGTRVVGVTRNPKVKATCLSNIQKALELLRRRRDMSQRFLWAEEEIQAGNSVVILGLLEDIHRMYDGQPARSNMPRSGIKESPYLGEFESQVRNMDSQQLMDPVDEMDTILHGQRESESTSFERSFARPVTPPTEMNATVPTPVFLSGLDHQPPRPEPFVQSSVSASSPGMSRLSADAVPQAWTITPTTKQNGVGGGGLRRVSPSPSGASSNHSRIPIPASSRPSAGAAFRNSPNNGDSGRGGSSLGGVGGILASQDLATSQLASGSIISHPNQEPKPSREYLLAKWMESVGVKLSSPFVLEGTTLSDFSNGVILCDLVSALDHVKIPGVSRNPKSSASALHNIRKALEILQKKKSMPLDFLWSEADIHVGDPHVIVNLLDQIRRAFGQKLSEVARKKELVAKARTSVRSTFRQGT